MARPEPQKKSLKKAAFYQRLRGKNFCLEIKFGVAGTALFNPDEQITSIETHEKLRAGLKQAQSLAEAEALICTRADFYTRCG